MTSTLLFYACKPINQQYSHQTPTNTQKELITKINFPESTELLPSKTKTSQPLSTIPRGFETSQSYITVSPTITSTTLPLEKTYTEYTIQAALDYQEHRLTVNEQINFTNNSSDNLESLILMVDPRRYAGCFELLKIAWEDDTPITEFTWRNTQLIIFLPYALTPNHTIKLQLSYQLYLPQTDQYANTRPRPFGFTEKQINLGDWYPFIPPYHNEKGWLANDPGYFGEYLVYDIADYLIDLELIGEETELVIASSAGIATGQNYYHFEHRKARNFALSMSPYFVIEQETIKQVNGSQIQVYSYFFPLDEKAGKRVLETTAQALKVFGELFGPYPHKTMNAVQADFLDGMEYDGLYFLSKDYYNWHNGTYKDFLVTIAAHETAHQWWYGLVGNDQAFEPWLDEALCTYSEHLFFERVKPEALNWWWNYRVNYYNPHGYIDIDIYMINQETYSYFNDYRNVVYLNGAIFLDNLRSLIGEEIFIDFLWDYRERFSYQQATGEDFFNLLKAHSEGNLDPLLKDFFFTYPY